MKVTTAMVIASIIVGLGILLSGGIYTVSNSGGTGGTMYVVNKFTDQIVYQCRYFLECR